MVVRSHPLFTAVSTIMILIMLSACDQSPKESKGPSASKSEEKTEAIAPGIITGDEELPPGHPPIEGLQEPAPTALGSAADAPLPANHPPMPEGEVDMGIRPDGEPEHPSSSGKELKVEIPESVSGKWSSVLLEVSLADSGTQEVRALLGQETILSDDGLVLQAEIFLPAYISDFETIKSVSNEPTNPAVKIRLFKDQKAVAVGWLFQKFPEFDSFKSELGTFRLLSAEPIGAKH